MTVSLGSRFKLQPLPSSYSSCRLQFSVPRSSSRPTGRIPVLESRPDDTTSGVLPAMPAQGHLGLQKSLISPWRTLSIESSLEG